MGYLLPVKYNELNSEMKKQVRNQYLREQNHKCWYCNCDIEGDPPQRILDKKLDMKLFPPNMLKYPVHLQHDHETGLTEGAVHAYCNAVLWQHHGR